MKCSECEGQITTEQHAVFMSDGSQSGIHRCQNCGRTKGWFIKGYVEEIVDMSDTDDYDNANKEVVE